MESLSKPCTCGCIGRARNCGVDFTVKPARASTAPPRQTSTRSHCPVSSERQSPTGPLGRSHQFAHPCRNCSRNEAIWQRLRDAGRYVRVRQRRRLRARGLARWEVPRRWPEPPQLPTGDHDRHAEGQGETAKDLGGGVHWVLVKGWLSRIKQGTIRTFRRRWRPTVGGLTHVLDELNAPPSSSRFCPTIKPIFAEQRNAHASPNSAGSPARPAGLFA